MKRKIYLIFVAIVCIFATKSYAQYHITYSGAYSYIDTFCQPSSFLLFSNAYTSGLSVHTYYGDGTDDILPLSASSSGGDIYYSHPYSTAGAYTVKQVLQLGTTLYDSVSYTYNFQFCQTFYTRFFYDANSDCAYDSTLETLITAPCTIAVDSNGVTIDTIVVAGGGLSYIANGIPGDIYAFRLIMAPPGVVATCPASGVVYDTLTNVVNAYINKLLAFNCSGASGYDVAEVVTTRSGLFDCVSELLLTSQYCAPVPVTLTMNMSPKYNFQSAYPAPTSVSGHTITWNFPALSVFAPRYVYVRGVVAGTPLIAGDTVQSSYYLTPTAGDANPADNTVMLVDTIRASYDPNDKDVSPKGLIAQGAGTKLTYTIRFENTGNDTAFNIHIMDTLSDNVNARTLEVLASSANMTLNVQNVGGHNVVKFDFPSINLLDSTHHGQCDGMVTFTIKTKDGLALGTHIDNRAGIYFDYNSVVMTNTVTNIVGIPAGVEEMTNSNVAEVNVFPNPANSELTVNISKGSFSKVSIVNSLGQQVLLQDVNSASTKLNIKALPAGTYYISVRGESGVKTQMFQKM